MPNGRIVAVRKPIAEWDLTTPATAMDFLRHETHDNVLVIADPTGAIKLYGATTGQEIEPAQPEEVRRARRRRASGLGDDTQVGVVYSMAYLPQHGGWPKLVTVGGRSTVFEYDVSASVVKPKFSHRVDNVRLHIVDALQRPNGASVIAAGGRGGDVHLLLGATGGTWAKLPGHERAVHALKVLRREYWLVVAHEGSITTWDLSLEEPQRRNDFGAGDVRSLACYYDASGRGRVASAAEHGVQIWDPEDGRLITTFARRYKIAAITSINVGSGDPLLAVASDNKVVLWNPTTELVDELELECVHQGRIRSLARILSGSGRTLLAAVDDHGHVAVWHLPLAREAATVLRGHGGWINGLVAINGTQPGTDTLLASASDDATVRVWRGTGPDGAKLPHKVQVQALVLVPPDLLATGDEEGVIRLWSLNDRTQPKAELKFGDARHRIRAMTTYTALDDGVRIVSVGSHPNPVVWNVATESVECELRSGEDERHGDTLIRSVAAGRIGGSILVAAGDSAGRIKVWDAATPDVFQRPPQPYSPVQVRALTIVGTPEGALLAAGGDDGIIRLWEVRERSTQRGTNGPFIIRPRQTVILAHNGPVSALTVIDDGSGLRLASGGADGCLRTWDPVTGDQITEQPNAHGNWVRTIVQLAPTGSVTRLASGGDDGSIRLWDLVEGQLISSRHDVNIRGFGDRPAQSDLLSRQDIVEVLTDLLRPPDTSDGAVHDADEPLRRTTGPQVVTVEGAWGSGKTSLMWKLRRALDPSLPATEPDDTRSRLTPRLAYRILKHGTLSRHPAATGEEDSLAPIDRVITAWFNPWAHQSSEQVWAGLAGTIIHATQRGVGATVRERQAYWLSTNLDRLDRAAVRRAVRLRVWRPTLTAIAALLVPVTVALLSRQTVFNWINIGVLIAASSVLVALAAYAGFQWCRASVAAYLPEALLDGPLPPGALSPIPGMDPLMRDSLYYARTGQLHQTQRDIYELVKNLERRGFQLVVFIDDLDRCPARTTTEVFEAINGVLAEQYSSAHQGMRHLVCRFVVGLDATVVANRLADAYPGVGAPSSVSPDDPNTGWSVLRKLSQLSVMLPTIRDAHTTRLLKRHTPEPLQHDIEDLTPQPAPEPETTPTERHPAPELRRIAFGERVRAWWRPEAVRRQDMGEDETADVQASTNREQIIPLEGDPTLRDHLRQLVALRPRQSMRETKRLLTLWSYYVRLLGMRLPLNATATAQGARDVLTLAEIASRWPALMPALAQVHAGQSGLRLLIAAARAGDDVKWTSATDKAGLSDPQYQVACENLRKLLSAYGSTDLAEFADSLL